MTKTHHLPGASIEGTLVRKSVISEGCIIEAEEITHCIVGRRSVIGKGTIVRDCILMGNDHYDPIIGENCFLSKAIIDENVNIGNSVRLTNKEGHHHYDSPEGVPSIYVRDGILIVPKGTTIPDGFVF